MDRTVISSQTLVSLMAAVALCLGCGGQIGDDEDNGQDDAALNTSQKFYVDTFADAPGYGGATTASAHAGTLKKGTSYVFCKTWGAQVGSGGQFNHWWMLTDLDTVLAGHSGRAYVSAYYLSRWGNDTAKDNGGRDLPSCTPATSGGSSGGGSATGLDKTRSDWYLTQPNGWTCSATSLTMAEAAWHKAASNNATISRLATAMHVTSSEGLPGNASLVAAQARRDGLTASFNSAASASAVATELRAGHSCVVNGSLVSGGHFIYIGGLNANGTFLVGDPARSYITSWSSAELTAFMNHNPGQHPTGFACVWK